MTINPNDLPTHLATLERYHDLRRLADLLNEHPLGSDGGRFKVVVWDSDNRSVALSVHGLIAPKTEQATVDAIQAGIEARCEYWRERVVNAGFDPDPALDNELNGLLMYVAGQPAE